MVTTHNLGFPRVGAKRGLTFALKRYWKRQSSRDGLIVFGAQLLRRGWGIHASRRAPRPKTYRSAEEFNGLPLETLHFFYSR